MFCGVGWLIRVNKAYEAYVAYKGYRVMRLKVLGSGCFWYLASDIWHLVVRFIGL